ncbi:cupin domain-containing protein, partial [Pseudactinotalea suaedae]
RLVSTLSRLESGGRKPTLELLLPLARSHGVTLDDLIDAPPTGDPRVHLRPVIEHGMTMVPLTQRAEGIQAFKVLLEPDARPGEPQLQTHTGYEWIYVLDGRLRLLLGEHDLVLEAGEAAEFDTRVPHWLGPAEKKAVEFLSLFGKEGQRAHLRAGPRPRETSSTSRRGDR